MRWSEAIAFGSLALQRAALPVYIEVFATEGSACQRSVDVLEQDDANLVQLMPVPMKDGAVAVSTRDSESRNPDPER